MDDKEVDVPGLAELTSAVEGLDMPRFISVLKSLIATRKSDQLKLLVDGLEIQTTPTVFRDETKNRVAILEQLSEIYPFSRWLEEMGILPSHATRRHLCKWWDSYVLMLNEHGYNSDLVSVMSRDTNLWRATGALAAKMQHSPVAYRFLPALLINHAQEVSRVLGEIAEPEPFIEVLVGERIEDMRSSPRFLSAFSIVRGPDGKISRSVSDALWSVHLILQRD